MTDLSALPDCVVGISGAEVSESAFGAGPALWVNGKEVLHRDSDGRFDVRLTRGLIREMRQRLREDRRVHLRPSSSSDWIGLELDVGGADESLLAELASLAVGAHLPPPGAASVPAPAGADLARRKGFH